MRYNDNVGEDHYLTFKTINRFNMNGLLHFETVRVWLPNFYHAWRINEGWAKVFDFDYEDTNNDAFEYFDDNGILTVNLTYDSEDEANAEFA